MSRPPEADRAPVRAAEPLQPGGASPWLARILGLVGRRQVETELERLQRHHERILNSVGEGVHGIDREGTIIFENPAAATMLGWDVREMIGKPAHATMHHTRADGSPYPVAECHIYATLRDGVTRRVEDEVFWRKDGTSFHVAYTSAPIRDDAGAIVGAVVAFHDISIRRRAQEQLRQVVEAAPNALVMVNRDGEVTLVNTQLEALFGYARAELMGQPIERLVPERFQAGHPGHREGFFANPSTRAMGAGRDLFGLRQDGSEVPIEIGLNPVVTSEGTFVLASIIDITERKRAETRLRETLAMQRAILNHAGHTIISTTPDGLITTYNPAAERLLGYSAAEVVGCQTPAIIHDPAEVVARAREFSADLGEGITPGFEVFVAKARRNLPNEYEWTYVRKDGTRFPVLLSVTALRDDAGRLTGFLGLAIDITERKRAEAELVIARERAEAADRLKSTFLATMSHELRTPLNSIIGFTGIILQGLAGPLNQEQSKQLEMVRGSARHLLALINDLLDISKIEAGELAVYCEPFDMRASITDVTNTMRPLAEKKGLALNVELSPAVTTLVGDQRRVEQVLLNLLSNAVKFTESGSVTLRAEVAPDNAAAVARSVVRLSVTDTGMGIKAEDMGQLFQPFQQVDSGLSRNHEGTGLGLAICRKLAEKLGGDVRAESEWGKGSVFTFTLPIEGGTG